MSLISTEFSQYFTPEKLASLMRIGFLLFIILPSVLLLSKWVGKYAAKKLSPQQGMVFRKLFLYAGVVIIGFSLVSEMGFQITHLLGAAGILGIAIGFASQTSVSNVISGLFLIAEKPFEINDVIVVGDTTGQVLSIDMLSIKLRTFDNKFVRIPNETIVKSQVTNITRFPIRRMDLDIGIAYKEDVARVRKVLLEIARENPLCLNEPEPMVIFSGFGNSSVDLTFLIWAAKSDWIKVKNSIMEEVKRRFDEEKIEIPFPHLSLYSGTATQPMP
ncbi:MAG: mechanosensitive ion channel family protein, partial [Calditrichia bacterium]